MLEAMIAIAEDSEEDLAQLTKCLDRYRKEKGVDIRCSVFRNGMDFLEAYKPVYDLVLLDIEMPHLDGLNTAKRLRETDAQVPLIFITRMAQFAIKGYEVSALDFIVKPVQYGTLSEKLDNAFQQMEKRNASKKFVYLETGADSYRKVSFDDIYHVTKRLNYIIYATRNGEIRVRGTLKDAEETFAGSSIIQCAKGVMINLRHVDQKVRNVVTVNGLQFTVTKPFLENFTKGFMSFLKGEQQP